MSRLVIVESPTKARTITQFLGPQYRVVSSYGHVRDLPKKSFGVNPNEDFKPRYAILPSAKERIAGLKEAAKGADAVILATDEDREGEAIAWHIAQVLRGKKGNKGTTSQPLFQRIVFHEITKRAIEEALKHPRDIDIRLVNAQQARRILDRIVGYKLSPFLWRKVVAGLSAGRVQSVAVRLIVERKRAIDAFIPTPYWVIIARLAKAGHKPPFEATLHAFDGKTIEKPGILDRRRAQKIEENLKNASWMVRTVKSQRIRKNPPPPFRTSTLQQEAGRRLRLSAYQTMRLAQQLYEGVDIDGKHVGLITYMRTDSINLASEFLKEAERFIKTSFGETYWDGARVWKGKVKGAQEAHEAIRPTDPARTPEILEGKMDSRSWRIYQLIWQRSVASQMAPARFDQTATDIEARPTLRASGEKLYLFRATGSVMAFDGFLKVWPGAQKDISLPLLQEGETLELKDLGNEEHKTESLPYFTEASLIHALEELGIGRPSTYAPILSTIQGRGYIEKDGQRRLIPTDIGLRVNDLLVEHFPNVVDADFTAHMEEELDRIARGEMEWVPVVKKFWEPFIEQLQTKYVEVEKEKIEEETSERCSVCTKPMVVRMGRFGKFIACSGFPECRNTKPLPPTSLGITCPKCTTGEMVERRTKKRRVFYGCSRFPECDFALWARPTGEMCPKCGLLLVYGGKNQFKCSSTGCDFRKPTAE